MTRTQKIERIKKYRPSLYLKLKRNLPNLVNNPEQVSDSDILLYNKLIEFEAKRDKKPDIFINNFSF